MEEQAPTTTPADEYTITFKNGALTTLRALAQKLEVANDNLDEVITKGLKVLELPEDNKLIFKKGGETYSVDIKQLK